MGDASSDEDLEPAAYHYYDGELKALHITDKTKSSLAPDLNTIFGLPWLAKGKSAGANASWQSLRASLVSGGESIDIVAYAHAVQKRHGGELWVFAINTQVMEPSSGSAGKLITTLRGVVAAQHLRPDRGATVGAGGAQRKSRAPTGWKLENVECTEIEAKEIASVRELTAEEQLLFAKHVCEACSDSGFGWYLVPTIDGEGEGAARLRFYADMLDVESKEWREEQQKELFKQLVQQQVVDATIQKLDRRTAITAALPSLADVLIAHINTGDLLSWTPDSELDLAAAFPPELQHGLPRPIRVHTDVQKLFAPRAGESRSRAGESRSKPSKRASTADGDGGSSSSAGKPPKSQKAAVSSAKSVMVTVSDREMTLEAENEKLRKELTDMRTELSKAQNTYNRDMKQMMSSYQMVHNKLSQAYAYMLLLPDQFKVLAMQTIGVSRKFANFPPPFDPGARPFVQVTVRRSGIDASIREARPPQLTFATAYPFQPREYTTSELEALAPELFSAPPADDARGRR